MANDEEEIRRLREIIARNEWVIARLSARCNRLQNRIGAAYDALDDAKREDAAMEKFNPTPTSASNDKP